MKMIITAGSMVGKPSAINQSVTCYTVCVEIASVSVLGITPLRFLPVSNCCLYSLQGLPDEWGTLQSCAQCH